jgi:chemotaxis signal transduction protein
MAIVFNAAREFTNMLEDILGERTGFAAFVEDSGTVIASTGQADVHRSLIEVPGGLGVVAHEGTHYVCARIRAPGYREFKTSDGYDNRVSAVVALRLGANEQRRVNLSDQPLANADLVDRAQAMEVAVFQVGTMRFALPASVLVEAVAKTEIVNTPNANPAKLGLVDARSPGGRQMVPVICARQHFGVHYQPRPTDGVVLVLRSPQRPELPLMGLRVDDLLAVTDIDRRHLQETPRGFQSFAPWICGLLPMQVSTEHGKEPVLVQWIDAAWLTSLVQPVDITTETADLPASELVTVR